jgi:hypothetical protein
MYRRRLPLVLAALLTLPPLGAVVLPPGAGLAPAHAGGTASSIPRGAALVEALKTKRLKRVEFKELALKDLVTWMRTATGWNFVVNHSALTKADIDASALSFTADFEDLAVGTLLDVLLEPVGMALRVHDNIVFLTSKADALGRPITRLYGISHITWTKIDFIAPDMQLLPSNAPVEDYEPEVVDESDPLASGDAVVELVKDLVAAGQWETDGWSIRATNQYMVVRAPASVHALIPRALDTIASLK